MRTTLYRFGAIAVVAILPGCGLFTGYGDATSGVAALKSAPKAPDAYHQALFDGYSKFDTYEFKNMMHWTSSAYYSKKALEAANGQTPEPTEIAERALPEDRVGEITEARAKLMDALASGAAAKMPTEAADAQTYFDCWLEQSHENFQPKDIAECRNGFYKNLEAIAPIESMAEVTALKGDVLFDFDKYAIKPAFTADLDNVAAMMVANTDARVEVGGYTDSIGSAEYNKGLSLRRADAVAKYLETKGVTADRMTIEGYGEENPVASNKTAEGRAQNRRVELRNR